MLRSGGGRLPKHVGGKIICIHTICFARGIGWFNNMKQDTIIYLLVE